jgi:hypothetical protein
VCYCLRISNVDVGTSDPATALNTILNLGASENWGEIVMMSIHLEVDDSWSVDLGFRFVEDALVMWSRHGKRVRGRYWHIVPIQAVLGICFVARTLVSTRSSVEERIRQLKLCEALEEMLEQVHGNDRATPSHYRLLQIHLVLLQLAFQSDYIPSSGETLITEWADLYVDSYDIGFPPRVASPSLLDNMHPRVMSQAANWVSGQLELPSRQTFYRYQSENFVPPLTGPRPPPTTKSAKRHARQNKKLRTQPASLESKGVESENVESEDAEANSSKPRSPRHMSSNEKSVSQRNTRHNAAIKLACWISSLITLPPLPSRIDQNFQAEMLQLWNWYEDCLTLIRESYHKSGLSNTPFESASLISQIQEQSFRAAERSFAPASRLRKVWGPDYTSLMARIESREFDYQGTLYLLNLR